MFNYYDKDFSGHIEKEELWEMQLSHHLDNLSSLCTLVDLVMFDELGVQDGRLSPDEFIQAFGRCFKGGDYYFKRSAGLR